jgi:pimeloyl-ACP methyl ester carboxylesterase
MTAVRRMIFVLGVLLASTVAAQRAPADLFVPTVNNSRLHILDWGGPQPGKPTLILLHGIARHAHTFDHIAPEFAKQYRVLAVDMRGHGDSSWNSEGKYEVLDYVLDREKAIDQLQLRRVSLLGNSTGGRVAQVYAGLHPDKVDELVVEDVGPERPQSIADAFARRVEQEKNGWATEDDLVAQLVMQNRRTPEPLLRTYAHFGLKTRADGRLIWKRDPNLVKGFVEIELWDYVRKITAPTLYVLGGGSRIVPPETQQKLKETLPNARVIVMPGLGHYPDEEDTAGFMKLVGEFLK